MNEPDPASFEIALVPFNSAVECELPNERRDALREHLMLVATVAVEQRVRATAVAHGVLGSGLVTANDAVPEDATITNAAMVKNETANDEVANQNRIVATAGVMTVNAAWVNSEKTNSVFVDGITMDDTAAKNANANSVINDGLAKDDTVAKTTNANPVSTDSLTNGAAVAEGTNAEVTGNDVRNVSDFIPNGTNANAEVANNKVVPDATANTVIATDAAIIGSAINLAAEHSTLDPLDTVLMHACMGCRGYCCRNGAEHGYLSVDTMTRVLEERPDASVDQLVTAYMLPVAQRTMSPGCIYQHANGCTLPRELRSDTCNSFFCDLLKEFRESQRDKSDVRAFFVPTIDGQFEHGVFSTSELVRIARPASRVAAD